MKKTGIIICVLSVIALSFAASWFMYEMQNKVKITEQEKTTLYQKTQALEKQLISAQNRLKKEVFVNPLFYRDLEPVSRQCSDVWLTPNSRASLIFTPRAGDKKYDAGWDYEKCDLLENEQDYIVMHCQRPGYEGRKNFSDYYRFTIKPCDSKYSYLDCQYVVIEEVAPEIEWLGNRSSSTYEIR